MPWKEKTVEEKRAEFIARVQSKEASKSALCREYGISRVTGDKWLKRSEMGQPLSDQSRAPFHRPNRLSEETEACIVAMRQKEPALGAKKIQRMMKNEGWKSPPAVSTINAVLKRNGLITPQASRAAQHYTRFQKDAPNDMWQADFKGNFLLKDGTRCHPLSIIDDYSRFCLCADARKNEQFLSTKESFIRAFQVFGLPRSVLCDNGTPWGSSQSTSITRFEVWLMELGVLTLHIRQHYPQCQGKVERFNGSYKRERLAFYTPDDMADAQRCRVEYMDFYNNARPHEALNMDTPAQHYTPSQRQYSDRISPWEYESGSELRRVKSSGYLTFAGQGYYLSEGLGGKEVMLFPCADEDGVFEIVFREFVVAKLSLPHRTIRSRRVYLRYDDPRKKL